MFSCTSDAIPQEGKVPCVIYFMVLLFCNHYGLEECAVVPQAVTHNPFRAAFHYDTLKNIIFTNKLRFFIYSSFIHRDMNPAREMS